MPLLAVLVFACAEAIVSAINPDAHIEPHVFMIMVGCEVIANAKFCGLVK